IEHAVCQPPYDHARITLDSHGVRKQQTGKTLGADRVRQVPDLIAAPHDGCAETEGTVIAGKTKLGLADKALWRHRMDVTIRKIAALQARVIGHRTRIHSEKSMHRGSIRQQVELAGAHHHTT